MHLLLPVPRCGDHVGADWFCRCAAAYDGKNHLDDDHRYDDLDDDFIDHDLHPAGIDLYLHRRDDHQHSPSGDHDHHKSWDDHHVS
jgi:hypothetical protein